MTQVKNFHLREEVSETFLYTWLICLNILLLSRIQHLKKDNKPNLLEGEEEC